jgi:hypothetical protein
MSLVLAGLLALPACDSDACDAGDGSYCDHGVSYTCEEQWIAIWPDSDYLWIARDCGPEPLCMTLGGVARCVLEPTPSPTCEGQSTGQRCADDTRAVECVGGMLTMQRQCQYCTPGEWAIGCNGGLGDGCAEAPESCLPGMACQNPSGLYAECTAPCDCDEAARCPVCETWGAPAYCVEGWCSTELR